MYLLLDQSGAGSKPPISSYAANRCGVNEVITMRFITIAALTAALTVGAASAAFSQAGSGSNTSRTESARTADRDDSFDWGWLGLLGLGGLAGLIGRDRRRTDVHTYPTATTADRSGTGTSSGTAGRGY